MIRMTAFIAALLFSVSASALDTAQRTAVRADVLADPALSALPPSSDAINKIIAAYSVDAAPACTVWRTKVTQDEIEQNGFDWIQVDNLTAGKARIWDWMFNSQDRSINPSKLNVRLGIDETWKGTAAMLAVRTAVYLHLKRPANRLEKLFAVGTCTDAAPSTMAVEGGLSYEEVRLIMGW